jgi:hypothetical protein
VNYLLVIATSLLGAHLTYWLTHKKKRMNSVRASSLLTLLFVAATVPVPYFFIPKLQAAFFGATFVGMSDPSRLCEKRVLVAGLVFSLIFCFLLQFRVGLGGTLGASAFFACLLVHFSTKKLPF